MLSMGQVYERGDERCVIVLLVEGLDPTVALLRVDQRGNADLCGLRAGRPASEVESELRKNGWRFVGLASELYPKAASGDDQ